MKSWFKPAILIAFVLIAATAYIVKGRAAEPTAEDTGPEVQLAEKRSLEITAEAAGMIEPIRLVEVKSKASGEILRLHAESGDAVKRGELLGEVDPRDVRNAFAQAEADLAVAEARSGTAAAQKKRSVELRAASVITEQELESATMEEANAKAQLIKARVNLDLARERQGDVTIRAPIDGIIISRTVEEGAIIQSASQNISGGTAVFVMADLAVMQVRTLVDETDLGKIQPGQQARVAVEAYPGRVFQGTVMKIEPQAVVEQNVTMFPVLVRLDNPDGALKPGMNAEVTMEVARRVDVVTVPNAAIVAMKDANTAGKLFGITEEQMKEQLSGRPAVATGDSAAVPRPDGAPAMPAPTPDPAAGQRAGNAQGAPEASGATPRGGATAGRGAGARGGRGGRGGGIGGGDTRRGVIFVQEAGVVKARSVTLGLNDWDYTEVIRGVQPGDSIVMISVARLQQQQQDMLDQMRGRMSGPLGGVTGGAPGGGGAAGGRGGPR